jgi:hypothetical protein
MLVEPKLRRVLATVLAFVASASPAGAQTLDFDGGTPAIGDFSPITLNGTQQLTSLTIAPFSITDSTGSGAGWNIELTVPDLVNGGSTILASTISMDAPVVTAGGGASMTGVAGHAPAGGLAAGEKIVIAEVGAGAGTYLVSPAIMKLTVPANARAGTYVSAATIAVLSGP